MRRMQAFVLFDLSSVVIGETQQVVVEMQASNGMDHVGIDTTFGIRRVMLWQLVDESCAPRRRQFLLIRTGNPLPDGAVSYLGTVQDVFVWHLFEVLCG